LALHCRKLILRHADAVVGCFGVGSAAGIGYDEAPHCARREPVGARISEGYNAPDPVIEGADDIVRVHPLAARESPRNPAKHRWEPFQKQIEAICRRNMLIDQP
jgi:hypothetical protein